jgi:transcriptional regulator with XRE-family HTH domain
MDLFSQRLRQRAQALGLSNAEVARRAGLTERRYGNYIAGLREPDLATIVKIAQVLATTPNHLLGIEPLPSLRSDRDRLAARLKAAVQSLEPDDVERVVVQIEAVARLEAKRASGRSR